MSGVTDFYYFTAFISPDFLTRDEERSEKLKQYLTSNEMRDLELTYNKTKTNSVEIIYRHSEEKAPSSNNVLGLLYALDHIPGTGLNAHIVMRNNKRDDLSRRMHAKIQAGTLGEVSIGMKLAFGPDNVTKKTIVVDHIALLDIPSYFAYAQKTTGAGSYIKKTPGPTFPNKEYPMTIAQERLSDFLNFKKTVGQFLIYRSFAQQKDRHPLAVNRDFMSESSADSNDNKASENDAMPVDQPQETKSENPAVSERIAAVEGNIKELNDSIAQIEGQLKTIKADGSPEAKAAEQELLAALESTKKTKAGLEVSLDQLIHSGGLEAATIDHILKTSKEASVDSESVKSAVAEVVKDIYKDISEETQKKIERAVATNADLGDAFVTVTASFASRKRKATGAAEPDDAPAAKRTKLLEEKLDVMQQQLETLNRSFTSLASAKTTAIADILQQARDRQEKASKLAADVSVKRSYGGSSPSGSSKSEPKAQRAQEKTTGRVVSEDEIAARAKRYEELTKTILSKTTNSSMSH